MPNKLKSHKLSEINESNKSIYSKNVEIQNDILAP